MPGLDQTLARGHPRPEPKLACALALIDLLAPLLSIAGRCLGLAGRSAPGSTPGGVALHAACICGGLASCPVLRGGAQAALRPVGTDLDLMATPLELRDRAVWQPSLHHQDAGACRSRPKRQREVFDMPGWRVDRLLQVHFRGGA